VLDGTVLMKIPPGTQGGSVFRLRGKGFPRASGGARGDAHVRVAIETPAALGDRARALLSEVGGLLDDQAFPRRQAFREASRKAAAAANGPEGDVGKAGSGEGGR
jgi:molecular chaperone DnaJ